ncbi:YbaK/EbsC family protein [Pseudomaricurvus alkylphenolicus]|jgi:Ala-tRNA(Pro) deacylase|uniref:aminoacyl-tRNA deacylase n=1 Tax=Pseudomaricurvus alkylphenolicus TaxID=1306991 RepID=UPI001420810A|nr:YbaK/EbsC family protein [Pseudomaricurvus alkylphenolicus]NIB41958.1 YbaK/EbsC family protein [Pseudomaricurvus alkylphenolicus]
MAMTFLPAESYLAEHQLKFDTLTHPQSATSMQTARLAHISPAQMVKSVILWNGDGYLMCLLPASHVLVLSWVDRETGHKHRLATEEELAKQLRGCEPGAVPALGQAFDMRVLWDHCLKQLDDVYFEAGDHKRLIHMRGAEFMSLLDQESAISLSCSSDSMEYYQHIH